MPAAGWGDAIGVEGTDTVSSLFSSKDTGTYFEFTLLNSLVLRPTSKEPKVADVL